MDRGDMDEENIEQRDLLQTHLSSAKQEESLEDSVIRRQQFEALKEEISKVLDSMHPREAGVIRARFGLLGTKRTIRLSLPLKHDPIPATASAFNFIQI
jgi:DNA-directed RNA polymerase sigma subunit (sigma70/sigma32)